MPRSRRGWPARSGSAESRPCRGRARRRSRSRRPAPPGTPIPWRRWRPRRSPARRPAPAPGTAPRRAAARGASARAAACHRARRPPARRPSGGRTGRPPPRPCRGPTRSSPAGRPAGRCRPGRWRRTRPPAGCRCGRRSRGGRAPRRPPRGRWAPAPRRSPACRPRRARPWPRRPAATGASRCACRRRTGSPPGRWSPPARRSRPGSWRAGAAGRRRSPPRPGRSRAPGCAAARRAGWRAPPPAPPGRPPAPSARTTPRRLSASRPPRPCQATDADQPSRHTLATTIGEPGRRRPRPTPALRLTARRPVSASRSSAAAPPRRRLPPRAEPFLRYLATTQHKTVLISSHVLSEVEQTVDSVVIIAQGRLIREGALKDLLSTALTAGGTGGNNGQATPPLSDPAQVRTVYGTAFGIGSLFTLILGVIAICGEFRHQTITPTFLATPRRNRVVQAKVAGVVIAGGLSGILMIATGLLVGAIVISARGFGTRLGSGDVQQVLGLMVLGLVVWAVFTLRRDVT